MNEPNGNILNIRCEPEVSILDAWSATEYNENVSTRNF